MSIDPTLWPKLHGASTHFPVALAMAAALFDGLSALLPASSPRKAHLRAAGYFTVVLGALGTFPAVLSGLFMTRGRVLGHGAELFHHLFVWPAFALLAGLGVWRAMAGDRASPRGFALYLGVLFLTAGLMAGAGYWGGELILAGEPASASVGSPRILAEGARFYAQSCADCHGDDGRGDEGPDLHSLAISNARIASQIRDGTKGEMPSFAKKYKDPEISALVAYLRSLR